MKESEISETAKGNVYELEMVKGKNKVEVAFDMNGKIIKNKIIISPVRYTK